MHPIDRLTGGDLNQRITYTTDLLNGKYIEVPITNEIVMGVS